MKLAALAILAALALGAQTLINVGGAPAPGGYVADTVCGGTVFPVPGQTGVYTDSKYGPQFSCDVPVPNGTCIATLLMLENRPAGPNPATDSALGLRVFTVSQNGGPVAGPIDLFDRAGPKRPYALPLEPVAVTDGHLRLQFTATRGNAILSGLRVDCTPPPSPPIVLPLTLNPDGTVTLTGTVAALWRCDGATSGTSDCTGEYYVQIKSADGSVLKLIGVPADPQFAVTPQWTPVKQ